MGGCPERPPHTRSFSGLKRRFKPRKRVFSEDISRIFLTIIDHMKEKFLVLLLSQFYFFFFFVWLFAEEDLMGYIKGLRGDSSISQKEAILELFKNGKDSIPSLIDSIECNKKIMLMFTNPRLSFRRDDVMNGYAGIASAYVIEFILAKDRIDERAYWSGFFLLGSDIDNYIYSTGVIIKKNGDSIRSSDLSKIRLIYKIWWKKNRDKPIEVLREEWKQNNRPLTGSKYRWI